ncbi:uncharacterized protein LOC141492962 isoform X2 [Macrotis lagotis]|uniref:uncharacterized protein LOC141492962 isoform X2 n=1 Tax=Macrotis lagotis TaxID=92651 RepID=UPI003D69683D
MRRGISLSFRYTNREGGLFRDALGEQLGVGDSYVCVFRFHRTAGKELHHAMESDSVFQDPGLPFPSGQILVLYEQLFQAPARPDELLVAMQQVRGANCPQELELPLVLLVMEQRRQEQEEVLWDLELLTGTGLSLFWPRRGQFRGPCDEARSSENHNQESCIWHSRRWPLAQENDIRKSSQQLLEKWRTEGLAVMLGIARAEGGAEPGLRFGSPGMPGRATLELEVEVGTSLKADTWELEGVLEKSQREQPEEEEPRFSLEPDFTTENISRDKGSQNPGQGGRNLPELIAQEPDQPSSQILYFPETLKSRESWPLLEMEDLQKGDNSEQLRAETQRDPETLRDHKEKRPQSWREVTSKTQREESPKTQRKERPQIQTQYIQREEILGAQGEEIPHLQTHETPKLQREKIPWARRNKTSRTQGEEILWPQKEEMTWVQREETPKIQRSETSCTQVETPNVQRGENSQVQREETPKTQKEIPSGKTHKVPREETAETHQGESQQAQHEEIPQILEREKQVLRQIFQFQGSQFLHSLEGENFQFHEEEVSQFQKRDNLKFWGKDNPQTQGEIQKEDKPPFYPGEYPLSQGKKILQPQSNKIPQGQGKVITYSWGRETPWSLGKATPQVQSQLRLGPRPGRQEAKQLKTPAQWRFREQEAVKLGVQSLQIRGPSPVGSRQTFMEDGQSQPPSLLPNCRALELQQPHPNPPSRELVFLGLTPNQKENTLKRLLELQGEAGRRHQRDREQQRLRVQERLCITRNRRSGEDLLGSSLITPQPWMQGDVAQQRCALREQLEHRHKERTGLLQARRERNTRNFQELLQPQKIGENPLLPALFQPSWDLRRVSGQEDDREKGSVKFPDCQKSEVSAG